jgi:hypothetical protein
VCFPKYSRHASQQNQYVFSPTRTEGLVGWMTNGTPLTMQRVASPSVAAGWSLTA